MRDVAIDNSKWENKLIKRDRKQSEMLDDVCISIFYVKISNKWTTINMISSKERRAALIGNRRRATLVAT